MSGATGLDVRLPIGWLFGVLGLIIAGFGLATDGDAALYRPSLGVNINLWWGLVMLIFSAIILLLARAGRGSQVRPADQTPMGRETERREHALGLEREP